MHRRYRLDSARTHIHIHKKEEALQIECNFTYQLKFVVTRVHPAGLNRFLSATIPSGARYAARV